MKSNLNILLIEENPDHAELIIRSLPKVKITQVKTYSQCFKILKTKKIDLILMDYIEESSGVNLIRDLKSRYLHIPLIVITGEGDEQTAAKSIQAGANEYIVKTRESLQSLPKIITKTIKKEKLTGPFLSKKRPSSKKTKNSLWNLFNDFEKLSKSLRLLYKELNLKKGKKSKKR